MILQTFENPAWTVTEVGRVYSLIVIVGIFLIYNLFDSIQEIISDFKKKNKI